MWPDGDAEITTSTGLGNAELMSGRRAIKAADGVRMLFRKLFCDLLTSLGCLMKSVIVDL